MSFARSSFAAVVAAPVIAATLSFGLPANANADEVKYIEPSTADLSQPVDACVKSTPGQPNLTAYKKLLDILERQNQIIAIDTNILGVDGKGGVGSTKVSVDKNLTGKGGYFITSSYPKVKNEQSDGFCLLPLKNSVARKYGVAELANSVNRGQFGIVLENQAKSGSFTVGFGRHHSGSIYAIHFNQSTNSGRILIANAYGNDAVPSAYIKDLEIKSDYQLLLAGSLTQEKPTILAQAQKGMSP